MNTHKNNNLHTYCIILALCRLWTLQHRRSAGAAHTVDRQTSHRLRGTVPGLLSPLSESAFGIVCSKHWTGLQRRRCFVGHAITLSTSACSASPVSTHHELTPSLVLTFALYRAFPLFLLAVRLPLDSSVKTLDGVLVAVWSVLLSRVA